MDKNTGSTKNGTSKKYLFDAKDPIERLNQLAEFVDNWFEADVRTRKFTNLDIDNLITSYDFEVPLVLRQFYSIAKNWPFTRPFAWKMFEIAHPGKLKILHLPTTEDLDSPENHELLKFGSGTNWWACPLGEDDPPVYDPEFEIDQGTEPHPYPAGRCSLSLSDFLIGWVSYEIFIDSKNSVQELTPLDAHIKKHPELIRTLHDNIFGQDLKIGLYQENILIRYDNTLPYFEYRAPDQASLIPLKPYTGELVQLTINWNYGFALEERHVKLNINKDGSCNILCTMGEFGQSHYVRFSHIFNLSTTIKEIHNQLSQYLLSTSNPGTPTLKVTMSGNELSGKDASPNQNHLDPTALQPFIQNCIGRIEDPSEALMEDAVYLLDLGTGKTSLSNIKSLKLPTPELDSEFILDEFTSQYIDSVWKFHATRITLHADGSVTDVKNANHKGLWRIIDGLFYLSLNYSYQYKFKASSGYMKGSSQLTLPPYKKQIETMVMISSPILSTLTEDPDNLFVNSAWTSKQHNIKVLFEINGKLKFYQSDRAVGFDDMWTLKDDQLLFENRNTYYELTINDIIMVGIYYTKHSPKSKRPIVLTRTVDVEL